MCYYLYGAINDKINKNDYRKINSGDKFYFSTGTKKEVNECVSKCGFDFRITNKICDCDSVIGCHKTDEIELKEFERFLESLGSVRGIKHIYLCRNWAGDTNQKEMEVHVSDIDIVNYLANIEDNCLYKFNLYKRYY